MCGIAAVFRRDGRPVEAAEMRAMHRTMVHRGPDDEGLFVDGPVGLGFQRLKVIDLDGGHQPMANARGTVHVVYNGEIYNYRSLRRQLEAQGVPMRTDSDTETILGLYDRYGPEAVDHLHGMFAFVLWDAERKRLMAARDRLGIKPLYLYRSGATVAFASEIKAFSTLPEWRPEVAAEALPEYLTYRSLAGRRTLFRGVEKVEPGEWLTITADDLRRQRYWQLPEPVSNGGSDGEDGSQDRRRTGAAWAEELHALLERTVGEHLVADVPLGTFNSGGLDSSLVTALTARRVGDRLNTYSVGFDDPAFDESPYADLVSQRFGTDHHALRVAESDYAASLETAIWHHDEPLDHPHSVHLLHLSRLARETVTVALTGEGADELFGGYTRYRLPRLLDGLRALPATWRRRLLRIAARGRSPRERMRLDMVLANGGPPRIAGLAAHVGRDRVASLLIHELAALPEPRAEVAPGRQLLARTLWYDQQTYLRSLLNRMDKMSMAASLEGRVPFLDHRVVELAARIPTRFKLHGLRTKYLLKEVARRHLPARIVDRRKAGFAVPIAAWLRPPGPLAPLLELLQEPRARARGHFVPGRVDALIDQHRAGTHDHGEALWGLVNLELWQRLMIDRGGAAAKAVVGAGGLEEVSA